LEGELGISSDRGDTKGERGDAAAAEWVGGVEEDVYRSGALGDEGEEAGEGEGVAGVVCLDPRAGWVERGLEGGEAGGGELEGFDVDF
jgi:hypothetical protein